MKLFLITIVLLAASTQALDLKKAAPVGETRFKTLRSELNKEAQQTKVRTRARSLAHSAHRGWGGYMGWGYVRGGEGGRAGRRGRKGGGGARG